MLVLWGNATSGSTPELDDDRLGCSSRLCGDSEYSEDVCEATLRMDAIGPASLGNERPNGVRAGGLPHSRPYVVQLTPIATSLVVFLSIERFAMYRIEWASRGYLEAKSRERTVPDVEG